MKCGIRPVFVMDGQFAPAIKEDTLQHRSLKMKDCTKENPTDRSSMSHANIKVMTSGLTSLWIILWTFLYSFLKNIKSNSFALLLSLGNIFCSSPVNVLKTWWWWPKLHSTLQVCKKLKIHMWLLCDEGQKVPTCFTTVQHRQSQYVLLLSVQHKWCVRKEGCAIKKVYMIHN